jgi:MFS family permease
VSRGRLFTGPFVLCTLSNLFQALSFNLCLHFPGFLKDLGAGALQIGLIFSLTAISAIAVRPTLGRVMDARGRRGVILVGNALNTAVMALYMTVDSIGTWIFVVRILHGIAEAMLFTALFTYAADCVPERRRNQGLMLFGVSGMLPIALSAIVGDEILAAADYATLFRVALGFGAVALVASLPLPEMAANLTASERELPRGFRVVLRQRDLAAVWGITMIFALALAAMFTFLKVFVEETEIGTVGGFFAAYAGVAIAFRIFLGWLPDRVGPKRVLFPALMTLALGFVVMALARDSREVLLAGALCGAGHGYTFPLLFGMVVNRARDADRGTAMSIYTALFDFGVLIGGPLLGAIIDLYGFTVMFSAAAVLIVVGTLGFAVADRGRS